MFDMKELPFLTAVNNEELIERVKAFGEEKYKRDVGTFMERVGNMEDGKASESCKDAGEYAILILQSERIYGK